MTRQGFANGTPEPGRTLAEKEATLKRIGEGLTVDELEVIRQNFSRAGLVKSLLKKIPVRTGAERVEKITDFTPQKNFMDAFLDFMNKEHDGNFSAASIAIGEDRSKIRGIFDRVIAKETGERKNIFLGKGGKLQTTIPEPKEKLLYSDATTAVKADQKFFKNKIKNYDKKKFYNARDLGNILGLDFAGKKDIYDKFTRDLKRFGVKKKVISGTERGGIKKYQLGDVVDKLTEGYKKKLVKGERVAQTERLDIEDKLDPELKNFLSNFRNTTRSISKEEDIFVPNAVEDVGHPLSVKITSKYPKLTKNSNINKINTLTFQDPQINRELLEKTGYEAKHDSLLKSLNKLVNKKIGPKEIEELESIKVEMNNLYDKALIDIKNLAKENPYMKGQENRLPKIDINIPKKGQTFKSEDLFVDMSNVNPAFRVGLVDQINPKAKFFKDLNKAQKEIYKRNVLDQTKFNLDKFYKNAGYSKEQINELKDSLEFGTSSKLGIATVGALGLGTAAAADEPGATKEDSILPEAAVGTAAVAPLATKTGRSIYGSAAKKALQALGTPSAAAGFAGLSVLENLKEGKSIPDAVVDKEVGIELLFPELAKRAVGKLPSGSGILSQIGRVAANPFFRAARLFTPAGAALTAAGLAKDYGKFVQSEIKRKAADPEAYIAEQEEQMGIAAADGGLIRLGYAEGSDDKEKINKGRRRVVKILGGIASLPIIGRFFDVIKLGAPAAEKVAEKVAESGVPDYFWKLYNTIKSKGILSDEVKVDPRVERTTTYKNYKLEEGAYGDPDETVITKINDKGDFGYTEESMRFKKGRMDEDGFIGNEYEEVTVRPDQEGKLKDVEDGLDDGSVDEILEEIGEKTKID